MNGALDPDDLNRAEQALARLSDQFLEWAEADLASLRACLDEARAHPSVAAAPLERMARITHDMKGQAATFGYPLLTRLAQELNRAVHDGAEPSRLALVLEVLGEVVERRLAGDGGAEGQALLNRLA